MPCGQLPFVGIFGAATPARGLVGKMEFLGGYQIDRYSGRWNALLLVIALATRAAINYIKDRGSFHFEPSL